MVWLSGGADIWFGLTGTKPLKQFHALHRKYPLRFIPNLYFGYRSEKFQICFKIKNNATGLLCQSGSILITTGKHEPHYAVARDFLLDR